MRRSTPLIVFLILVVGGIVTILYYKKTYFPKYNWNVDYRKTSDQPHGLKLFYNIIKNQKTETTLLYNQSYELLDTNLTNSNFIFVGDDFYVDSTAALYLLKYVEKGNRVLISSNYCPMELVCRFVPVGDSIYGYTERLDSVVSLDFSGDTVPYPSKLSFHYQYLKDTLAVNWSVYGIRYFKDTLAQYGLIPFSIYNDSCVNSFYVKRGKGKIIFHANPVLFTNFYMVTENGFRHANNYLSQLHKGPTYWDDPYSVQQNNSRAGSNNPLKFLFSHPYLKWAWYLFLITIVLYLIFRSKREQRIIPLMPVNTNASIEYTKAIGTLYFQSKGHNPVANEMYMIFLSEVRSRYGIFTDIAETDLIDQLSLRSGINKSVLFNLFKQFKYVRNNEDATADDLIILYNAIEYYHKKRK